MDSLFSWVGMAFLALVAVQTFIVFVPRSRTKKKSPACWNAERDMDHYFSAGVGTIKYDKLLHRDPEAEAALQRALDHMTENTTLGKHNVSCPKCWERYEALKRRYCGG